MERKCIKSGYMFEYQGKGTRQWRRSKDDRWEIVVRKTMCGKVVGRRQIDGHPAVILKVRGKLFAAQPHYVTAAK